MTALAAELTQMRRPRLLIDAARHGLAALTRSGRARPAGVIGNVMRLLSEEAELDTQRREGGAEYSPRRHIDVLVALLAASRGR